MNNILFPSPKAVHAAEAAVAAYKAEEIQAAEQRAAEERQRRITDQVLFAGRIASKRKASTTVNSEGIRHATDWIEYPAIGQGGSYKGEVRLEALYEKPWNIFRWRDRQLKVVQLYVRASNSAYPDAHAESYDYPVLFTNHAGDDAQVCVASDKTEHVDPHWRPIGPEDPGWAEISHLLRFLHESPAES